MSDTNVDASDREENDQPKRPQKLDREAKMKRLQEQLASRKQRFYMLSEEIFDVNQDCMNKNDELKLLKSQYSQHNKMYVRALTELALKEADLQYKKEHAVQKSSVVTDFALESNQDVERLRADLKGALQKYQESRCQAKNLQAEFSKLGDTSRVESLNFLAFCKYSQSVQLNEMNKLTLSAELPSRKEVNICTTEFTKCAERSRSELASYYKQKIHEFQREERLQMGKCKTQFENSQRNKDGQLGFGSTHHKNAEVNVDAAPGGVSLDHHLHVNSLENRYAQKLLAEAQYQLGNVGQNGKHDGNVNGDGSFTFTSLKDSAKHTMDLTLGGALTGTGRISPTTNAVFAPTLFSPIPPPKSAKKSVSQNSQNSQKYQKAKENASYLAPTASTTHNSVSKYTSKEEQEPNKLLSATVGAQKSKFRAQLSALYRSKKKAASALSEMQAAKHKGVFDATAFRSPATATEDSALLQNTLLDASHTDASSNNMVQLDNGTYVDQGEQLGELIAKLCAAEGKFRQLNAIKEGLDVQLVKQAHFLLLVARDLQSDIATKARSSGHHASSLPPVSVMDSQGHNISVQTVSEPELTQAFARPDPSAHRSVGSLTAGGAISNKFRYRIDPNCVTAAPFVPLRQVQEEYEESEDKIRRIIAETAAVLKVL